MKKLFKSPKFLFTATLMVGMVLGPAAFSEDDDDREEESHSRYYQESIEGFIQKLKSKEFEIYILLPNGKKSEIKLQTPFEIVKGAQKLNFTDLKEKMKIRVSNGNKVEVL